jgi:putative two-component system response regulator
MPAIDVPCTGVAPLSLPEFQDPFTKVQAQRDMATSQLALYARDLKRTLDAERHKTQELAAAHAQLQAYAHDLGTAFHAERGKTRELDKAYRDMLRRLLRAAQYKDEETGAHLRRLSHYTKALALALGVSAVDAALMGAAAPMHDIGKIGIPDAILLKRGPLDPREWKCIQKHPALGASLLKGSPSPLLEVARQIALTHHERWDGSGYPQGLQGEAIPLAGRIVMLVDQYDALRSPRPYKPAFDHATTCAILLHGDGRTLPAHFEPRVLEAFGALHHEFEALYRRFED